MKKKIISVVLVMTMVFALLAVSASARPTTPNNITSIALSGVPASLEIGQDVRTISVTTESEKFTVKSFTVYDSGDVQVMGTITGPGKYILEVKLERQDDNTFIDGITQPPENAASIYIPLDAPGTICFVIYVYTVTEEIDSVTITGVPESLAIGQDVSAIPVTTQSEAFSVESATVYDSNDAPVTKITDPGKYTLVVELKPKDDYTFGNGTQLQVPENATSISVPLLCGGSVCLVYYEYTVKESTPTPDFDFSGLLGKIFDLIRWKKFTDDVKTISILTVIFKIIEAIVEKLAANIKK